MRLEVWAEFAAADFLDGILMARSVGARPKKAVRAQYDALKARLCTLTTDRWQAAQVVFDEMCALCDAKGPSGGQMVPRACRFCHHYGHSRQHCPHWLAKRERMTQREIDVDEASGYLRPTSLDECQSPAHWAWIQEVMRIEAEHEAKLARGLQGCTRVVCCAGDVHLRCNCDGCKEWHRG